MAKDTKEVKPNEEITKPSVETKTVSVSESQNLQKEGWVVIAMKRENGVKVHTLVKG